MNTKEKILEAAIDLFAQRSYADVSIREIARAVGIRESSIYNHFAGKQQILEEIIEHVTRELDAATPPEEALAEAVGGMSPEAFLAISVQNFESYFGNPAFVKVWRILSIERFSNARARQIYEGRFIDSPMKYQAKVFALLMDRGLIARRDPMLLAREFYSYILYIYIRFIEADKDAQPAGNPEFQKMILDHMEFFGSRL